MTLRLPQHDNTRKTTRIPDDALDILRNGFFAYLGTADLNCEPHVTAMFYIWDDETRTIHLITSKESKKVLNIRRNTNVSVTIDQRDLKSPARNAGVMVKGKALLVEMELVDDELTVKYLEKYIEFLGTGYPLGLRIAIRVIPNTIFYWKGTNFYRWKNRNL
jgi:nitroimidazol reductase NimA-like FMN-containing flavoprotein (pyridoxamine 5'-phosphate oxidase superfamily)